MQRHSIQHLKDKRLSKSTCPHHAAPPVERKLPHIPHPRVSPVGLTNLGNTCYMNAALQALCRTSSFVKAFQLQQQQMVEYKSPRDPSKLVLTALFDRLLSSLVVPQRGGETSVLSRLVKLKRAVDEKTNQFHGSGQHDSHEFLQVLVEHLHEEGRVVYREWNTRKRTKTRPARTLAEHADREWEIYAHGQTSAVFSTLYGQYHSKVTCLQCGYASHSFQGCAQLALELPATTTSLEECLKASVSPDVLMGKEAWRCPKCRIPRPALKQLALCRLPEVLILQLKRFRYRGDIAYRVNTKVLYPKRLDMAPFLSPACSVEQKNLGTRYRLTAVEEHLGYHADHGHYVTMAAAPTSVSTNIREWHMFDDSNVRRIRSERVLGRWNPGAAYLLFYQKMSST